MHHFTAHRLCFVTEVQVPIELNEHQGSALRGALYHALRQRFCAFARDPQMQCADCALATTCPVATLVSTLDPDNRRGQNRPRPYTFQPPLPGSGHPIEDPEGHVTFHYDHGEPLAFGLTLYADAMALFPYVVLAVEEFERGGLGRKTQQSNGRWQRGTLTVREIWAENPLTGEHQAVLRQGSHQVQVPNIPITHEQICEEANQRISNKATQRENEKTNAEETPFLTPNSSFLISNSPLALHFLTPTRLIEEGHLVKPEHFRFRPFFQRLLERLESLSQTFSDTPLQVDFPDLLAAAEHVRVTDNRLGWEEVASYSTRRHAESPISGLVGHVTLSADDWTPFLPWLLWGQFVHVGKDAVKGNGWYELNSGGPHGPNPNTHR